MAHSVKRPPIPKADDTWLSPKKDLTHLITDMTTPERSIEEWEKEFDKYVYQEGTFKAWATPEKVKELLTQTLQAERQKREGAVREILEEMAEEYFAVHHQKKIVTQIQI